MIIISKIFFCSDLHLGHLNIIKYEVIRRQLIWERYYKDQMTFKTFDEMILKAFEIKDTEVLQQLLAQHDDLIIENWNNTISKNDTVWCLGDFCLGKRVDIAKYRNRLNGFINLIKGNHDVYPDKVYLDAGFKLVSKYPIVLKKHFILSHDPFSFNTTGLFCNIFGHVHSSNEYEDETTKYICVCLERYKLKPIEIERFSDFQEPVFQEYTTIRN